MVMTVEEEEEEGEGCGRGVGISGGGDTSHARREPRELKRRGASRGSPTAIPVHAKRHGGSRSYRRFDDNGSDTGATNAKHNDDDVNKST